MKILIIEDDKSTQLLLEKIFGSDIECTIFTEAMDGIDSFVENMIQFDSYDAVLIDINLPDLNGVNVLRLLRKFESVKGIMENRKSKIIMMTGNADEQNVKESLKNGCDNFLIKPITKEKIETKFKAVGLKLNLIEKIEPAKEALEPQ